MTTGLTLHGYWRSSAAYRVRIALNLKGVDYAQVNHDLRSGQQREPDYRAVAPHGLVPALDTGRGVLIESPAILEWIEETYPAVPLLPADALGRAIVRSMAAMVACDIHPLNNLRVLQQLRLRFGAKDPEVSAWIAHWIIEGFGALERLIEKHGAGFAYGDTLTIADCCLVPQIYSAERFGVDLAPYPQIRAVSDAAACHPAFKAAHPLVQPDADAL
jgi:maleylpyruvate isomerase